MTKYPGNFKYKVRHAEKEMRAMTTSLVTFPVVDRQVCNNCKITLNGDTLSSNVLDVVHDAYGMPAVMVLCPVCKTPFEWETKCN